MSSSRDGNSQKTREEQCQELQKTIAGYFCGALTTNLILLGERLGYYRALAEIGPCSCDTLAGHLKLSQRYTAEWLRQQSAAKLISCDEKLEKFWLTETQKDVLVRENGEDASPYFGIGNAALFPKLTEAADKDLPNIFKSGDGMTYDIGGEAVACGVCRELGVWVRHFLVDRLKSLPAGIPEKLDSGCNVADVGCGCGEALMIAAEAFPSSKFHGYDISENALKYARQICKERNLKNVEFINPGVTESGLSEGVYDLVMTHDAIHDMARPQEVMNNVFKAMKPGGLWLIGDIEAAETHAENVHSQPFAALTYGFSCHLCLPSAMSSENAAGLGALGLSKSLAERMLKDAGFENVEILDWERPLNRYYLARKSA